LTKEERDKSRSAAVDGILIRAGVALDKVEDRETEFQTMSMLELAKNRMQIANQSTRGLDPMGIFKRAMNTSDFTNILADVANKAMLQGFEEAEETYDMWADTSGRVNDFKTHVFARASEAPSLVEINPDGGEYTYGKVTDAKESVTAVDYGIIVPFTRKAMVNDDLGALSDIREKLGAASRRKYGDLVYSVLTTNAAMGDGTALFHADHSNFVDNGSGAIPSVATLNAGAAAMATQKDLQAIQNLNIRPVYILSPWALKGTVDNVLTTTSPTAPGSASSPVMNPWSYLQAVYDARLDADDAAAWYLAGKKGMTVKLFTLNGNMTPLLETREGWTVDGMEFKCRITAAAKAMDWRGLYFNDGN
jgi:phage major head subunit gpT-like protein